MKLKHQVKLAQRKQPRGDLKEQTPNVLTRGWNLCWEIPPAITVTIPKPIDQYKTNEHAISSHRKFFTPGKMIDMEVRALVLF